jgi:uncharacterized protein (DUF1501 family)
MRRPGPLHRRTFLKAAAGLTGASLFGGLSLQALAESTALAPADRCFVFAYFEGGWDILLSLDPRDPSVFTAERVAETLILPGYNLLSGDSSFPTNVVTPAQRASAGPSAISFGPAIGRMANHYDLAAVVRGINMNTVAHEVGFRYFLTGKTPAGSSARGSSAATEIVGQMKPTVPIPQIALNLETYNDRYAGYANALTVKDVADLLNTLSPTATPLDDEIEQALATLNKGAVSCEGRLYDSRGLLTRYTEARAQLSAVLSAHLDRAFRFTDEATDTTEERTQRKALRALYGLKPEGSADAASSPAARAALIATALKHGVSQCVSVNLTSGLRLDTHFGTQLTQAQSQRAGWNALADLVTDLRQTPHPAGGDFMSHTTIVAFSEFSRSPLLNAAGGRDHHIANSCLILGAGIKKNRVFGATADTGLGPLLIDHQTGLASASGLPILPENVIATVLASAGLDYSITRSSPLTGLLDP